MLQTNHHHVKHTEQSVMSSCQPGQSVPSWILRSAWLQLDMQNSNEDFGFHPSPRASATFFTLHTEPEHKIERHLLTELHPNGVPTKNEKLFGSAFSVIVTVKLTIGIVNRSSSVSPNELTEKSSFNQWSDRYFCKTCKKITRRVKKMNEGTLPVLGEQTRDQRKLVSNSATIWFVQLVGELYRGRNCETVCGLFTCDDRLKTITNQSMS